MSDIAEVIVKRLTEENMELLKRAHGAEARVRELEAENDALKAEVERLENKIQNEGFNVPECPCTPCKEAEAHVRELQAEVERLTVKMDTLFNTGDVLCGEALQMTISVPSKQTEQAQKLERAVRGFREACLAHVALAKED